VGTSRWNRILLKLSGEAFAGDAGYGIDGNVVQGLAGEVVEVCRDYEVDVAIVVGGGNIWRGMSGAGAGMDRAQADYMGMLATAINAPALRAVEIEADVLLKGTHSGTDGIYTDDPRTNPEAVKLDEVTYLDVLNQGLRAMDSTAITLCMDNHLPIVMFDLLGPGNIRTIVEGGTIGTLVR
jgi:uridylate kinase